MRAGAGAGGAAEAAAAAVGKGCGPGSKRIQATVELGPNYIFHLAALAGAGFRSDYADRYEATVEGGDLDTLRAYGARLAWADGRTGELTAPAVFLPVHLRLGSAEQLDEYFRLLGQALGRGQTAPFLRRYGERLRLTADWVESVDDQWLRVQASTPGLCEGLEQLAGVWVRNFARYAAEVWPAELPGVQAAAARLNARLEKKDIIGRWERLTGETFRSDLYEIVLVSALKGGPNANSVGYDRNVFWSGSDPPWLEQFVSHETGTHLLIGVLKDYVRSWGRTEGPDAAPGVAPDFDLLYRAYENLARFLNSLVLGTDRLYALPPGYRQDDFQAVYSRLYAEDPRPRPREMLDRALRMLGGERGALGGT